ncbi:MAG: hypothetical protein WAQ10_05850 [Dethiobacteria bacterium]|nr:hypothetical protein [Bacillota bacterium]
MAQPWGILPGNWGTAAYFRASQGEGDFDLLETWLSAKAKTAGNKQKIAKK